MIITFHGGQSMRFQVGDMVIGVNPSVPPHGAKAGKFAADLVLCSSFASDHHNVEQMSHGDSQPFVIDGPGAYEYHGYIVRGERLGKSNTSIVDLTTSYQFIMDDMRVCVLGAIIPVSQLNPETSEVFSDVDILVIPVDSESPQDMDALINFIDPKVVLPVNYWDQSDSGVSAFLKNHAYKGDFSEKYTIKRKDIDSLSKEIICLSI